MSVAPNKASQRDQKTAASLWFFGPCWRRYGTMRFPGILLAALILVGCGSDVKTYDPRLEGIWKPNREMTFKELDRSKLSPAKIRFLEEHLGEIGFEFRKNRFAVINLNETDSSPQLNNEYEVISKTEDSVTISIDSEHIEDFRGSLQFVGNCFYSTMAEDYKEYLCRVEE
ncbi:hypothetical protein HBA55_17865 [Pseudomaricurvus alkylphenolicus]|uniref:hypothetical protein n=1 Tax=Pseudomaricurvus alkylphenolicus TaxID=1306991 RepID=UPI0014208F4D|nr:hypothetical protein [Pseudomaricurvus alkylphenolicus]NIB41474.1 hypothetical protein [Pseudomaricurvus alkylphenolicus]